MARGTSHKKAKCKLERSHILSVYRCIYPSAVAPVAASEAILWFVCARTRRFSQIRHHSVGSLADSFSSLYCHSVNLC